MDNNFDENKAAETEASSAKSESYGGQPVQNTEMNFVPPQQGQQSAQPYVQQPVPTGYGQPAGNYGSQQPAGVYGGQQYVPPQGHAVNYGGQQGMYPPPPVQTQPEKKKRLSYAFLWSLIIIVSVLFMAVVVLSVKIAASSPSDSNKQEEPYKELTDTQEALHTEIKLPVAEKPVLDDEYYQDKETGLLTSVGVAKTILPSQVQIKVFDEIPYSPVSSGSGIILTEDGYILTNAHVVDGAKRLSVKFYDETESEAKIVGMDKKSDLAVISVNRQGLVPAQIGTSSDLVIGEEVALAGAGGGFENTVTYGHVTGLKREIDTDYISSSTILCIQSDAALNPGNSGGALVNMYGQVVGVAVALMNHETYENIGFSISIDDAVPIAEDLIAKGYVSSRTRVGITYVSIGDASANAYGIPAGLCVMDVDPTSGAALVGLEPYDIITEIDGVRVFGAEEISDVLADKIPGDKITLSVVRKKVTGDIEMFSAELELVPDTSSISGYYVNSGEEDYMSRDVIK